MKTIERLRKYISDGMASGRFQPGDRLPSYWELTELLAGSYATIQSSMKKLADEGLVRIEHGNGTYITGDKPLKIVFLAHQEHFIFESFGNLLKKYLAGKNLNLSIRLVPMTEAIKFDLTDQITVRIGSPAETVIQNGNSCIQTCMEAMRPKYTAPEYLWRKNFFPCQYWSYQIGFNGNLLRKLGLPRSYFKPDFSWWNDFVQRCSAAGVTPCSLNRHPSGTSHIGYFFGFLLSQTGGDTELFHNDQQLFNTPAGNRLLDLVDALHSYQSSRLPGVPGSFFCNDAVMNLMVGGWIFVQNENPARPDIQIDDLQTISYYSGQKRIMPVSYIGLNAAMPEKTSAEDRKRLETFLNVLLDRDFQRDWCDLCGAVSLRNDLFPEDYSWNCNPFTATFFPQKEDLKIDLGTLLSPRVSASLSTILDFYKDYHADRSLVLHMMDCKKNRMPRKDGYISGSLEIQL